MLDWIYKKLNIFCFEHRLYKKLKLKDTNLCPKCWNEFLRFKL